MDERDAVSRLREGDIGGLEALVKEYQVSALRAAFIVTQDRPLAEDVVATAFLKAYDRIHQFDTRRPFRPWFLRIVVNDATKVVASRSRQVSLDQAFGKDEQSLADTLRDPGPSLEEIAERADARYAIGAALAKLSPTQRKAIVMRYYLGLGEAEVASQLENTPWARSRGASIWRGYVCARCWEPQRGAIYQWQVWGARRRGVDA